MTGELLRRNKNEENKKYSIIHWQTGEPKEKGEHLVSLEDGSVCTDSFESLEEMEQEDKNLLLKDLCARLPYKTKCKIGNYDYTIVDISFEQNLTYGSRKHSQIGVSGIEDNGNTFYVGINIENMKPYLFPLSGMTEEQKTFFDKKPIELDKYGDISTKEDEYGNPFYDDLSDYLEVIDWLNAHHFDYRGLIERGLAIDATDKGLYNKEEQP